MKSVAQVQTLLESKYPGYSAHYVRTKASGNYYFQVSEYVDGHTSTLDYFTVNPTTGHFITDFGTATGYLW